MPLEGIRKAVVLGLGKVTGAAVARALLSRGVEVRVSELHETPDFMQQAEELRSEGAAVEFGEPDPVLPFWADLIVPSPGVSPKHSLLATARERDVRVWSEIELGYHYMKGPLIAITGTNGKTTATTLCRSMLEASGIDAVAAGNIGVPFVQAAAEAGEKTIVCEVSSFQLAFIETFRPHVAVILNIADDHYDWHEGFDDYARAKARITERQTADDLLIVRADDPACIAIASNSKASLGVFGNGHPDDVSARSREALAREIRAAAGIADNAISVRLGEITEVIARLSEIRLRGGHNIENVLAAALAAQGRGALLADVGKAAKNFIGLPHRMQLVLKKEGITWMNDSKATNPHATLSALDGMDRVILIAGGRSKGIDLSPLKSAVSQLKGVVVMGEAASELEALFQEIPTARADNVEEAAAKARQMAAPGDTVLLSPACSSVDQYADYAERGERFVKAVKKL